jgi:hypothetical protein
MRPVVLVLALLAAATAASGAEPGDRFGAALGPGPAAGP